MEKLNESVNWCVDNEIKNVWEEMTKTIKTIDEEVLGRSRERMEDKYTWWLNKEVLEIISRKKKKIKEWQLTKSVEVRLACIEANREENRVVSYVRASKYEELYNRLVIKEEINEV